MVFSELFARCPISSWRTIRAATRRGTSEHAAAMNRFIAGYWRPVFHYLCAKGYSPDRAEDLTQEFFLRFVERDWLDAADPERGRFRTFLLTVLTRFLSDQSAARAPKQQTFDQNLVCISALLSDEDRNLEPPDQETAEDVFMKRWAQAVIANVRQRLETWCRQRGRPDWYQLFCAMHFAGSAAPPPTQESLARQFRLTRDRVRYALEQTGAQFSEFLAAEVAEQVESADDIEAEISELRRLLGD